MSIIPSPSHIHAPKFLPNLPMLEPHHRRLRIHHAHSIGLIVGPVFLSETPAELPDSGELQKSAPK